PFPVGLQDPIGLVADPAGRFVWVAGREGSGGAVRILEIAPSGRLTPRLETTPLDAAPDGLALSPDGAWMAVSYPDGGRVGLFAVQQGALVPVQGAPGGADGVIPGMPRPGPLLFARDPSGRLLLDVGSAPQQEGAAAPGGAAAPEASAVAVIDVPSLSI